MATYNFKQAGDSISVVAPTGGTTKWKLTRIGKLIGVPVLTKLVSETVEFCLEGVVTVPKATGFAVAEGGRVGFDFDNDEAVANGGVGVGYAVEAVASGATSVDVRLCQGLAGNDLTDDPSVFTVTDDDSATTNGTDLFVALRDGAVGRFYSNNAGGNNAPIQTADGALAIVFDDADPVTNLAAMVVYCDEDATDADGRLQHASTYYTKDIFVPFSDGRCLRIAYNSAAASAGVATHFDDDAADSALSMLFVSPTDADCATSTSTTRSHLGA